MYLAANVVALTYAAIAVVGDLAPVREDERGMILLVSGIIQRPVWEHLWPHTIVRP